MKKSVIVQNKPLLHRDDQQLSAARVSTFGKHLRLLVGAVIGLLLATTARAAVTVVSDNFEVSSTGSGFGLNQGVNAGINPPSTRLKGSVADNLRYLQTGSNRPASSYDIQKGRLRVQPGNKIARFTLSANGIKPFDFGPELQTDHASKAKKAVYDVKISMRNDATGDARFSFGISTVEGDISKMDFALQVYRAKPKDAFYTIQKRVDQGSFKGITTPNGEGDLNEVMMRTKPGTAGTMTPFLIRVTDAGAEGALSYNSRIQVSLDDGASWVYDTADDPSLPYGFRLDGTSRYFVFDQAPNMSGPVFYDDFSVTLISTPDEWKESASVKVRTN